MSEELAKPPVDADPVSSDEALSLNSDNAKLAGWCSSGAELRY